jgi:hypothetical protein
MRIYPPARARTERSEDPATPPRRHGVGSSAMRAGPLRPQSCAAAWLPRHTQTAPVGPHTATLSPWLRAQLGAAPLAPLQALAPSEFPEPSPPRRQHPDTFRPRQEDPAGPWAGSGVSAYFTQAIFSPLASMLRSFKLRSIFL